MNPAALARFADWYARYDSWEAADSLLRRSPAQAWCRRRAAASLAVLGYHGIEDPKAFARQLDRLARTASPVSLRQVQEAVSGGRPLPAYSVLITFDDGDPTVHTDALPLLADRGMPGVCFAVAGLIGTDTPFWWDEVDHLVRHGGTTDRVKPAPPEFTVHNVKLLPHDEFRRALDDLRASASAPASRQRHLTGAELRELEAGGITVGNHTLTHPCLDRCDDTEVRAEVLQAHQRLTALLGHPPTSFAYPNGNFDPRAHQALVEAGYRTGFLYDHRLAVPGAQHPLRISRLRVSTRTNPDRFETILSGLHTAAFRAERGVLRAARAAYRLGVASTHAASAVATRRTAASIRSAHERRTSSG